MTADLTFYFDPVCPFAWMTSKWVRQVAAQRDYDVEWRFISLRVVNAEVDYDAHFPPDYEAGHTAGLRLLRVAARARDMRGPEAVSRLYEGLGRYIFEVDDQPGRAERGTRKFLEPILAEVGLPADLADALDDEAADEVIRAETAEALTLTGKDVGTPILHFHQPGRNDPRNGSGTAPSGTAFFGPVISRLPSDEEAVALWDHVLALAAFPGFSELKRSLRERPQLPAFGVRPDQAGLEEDWHGGSRRLKR